MNTDFPPYLVVTGTVQVRGGDKRQQRQTPREDGETIDVHMTRQVSDFHRRGQVISHNYKRRLNRLSLLKTPFGRLVHTDHIEKLKRLVVDAQDEIEDFNEADTEGVKLHNAMVWEPLRGNRLMAVKAWLENNPNEAAKLEAAAA